MLSLRAAIARAKDGDTITFHPSLAGQTITLSLGKLVLLKTITIDGDIDNDGSADITVSGNNASRVFEIISGKATFDGVNVTEGNFVDEGGFFIARDAALTFSNATVSDNNGTWGGGVTSDGTVAVSGLEAGARWEYSTDGGEIWVEGSGAAFTLADGRYAAGNVQARQIDAAGNAGVIGTLSHKVAVNATDLFDIFRLVGDSNDAFDYFNIPHGQSGGPVETYAGRGPDAAIIIDGHVGDDTADLRAFKGTVTFNGVAGDDLLQFQHGTSGASTVYNGGTGEDALHVLARAVGSNLKLADAALTDVNGQTLLALDSVETARFEGGNGADTFDASAFTGRAVLDGGAGADTLRSGSGGSDITGGLGADRIHLGAGADRVIYDANGQSTLAGLDRIYGFDIAADELVFAADNTLQANKTLFQLPFFGSAIRFDNGVVEYRASAWSAWKTDLEGLSFGSLGISSLQKAVTAVATFAARNSVLTFEYDEEWYVLEVGNSRSVDNLVHLVGTDFSAATNVHDFVTFA